VNFRDRGEAGRLLARRLRGLKRRRPVVLGLSRGGIPVAAEIARALGAPLDVLVIRKLGCPWQPELGFGAIGEEGVRILNDGLVRARGAGHAVVAVPVASTHAAHELASMADGVVCLERSEAFGAIGEFYDDFTQTSDEEVAAALASTASPAPA
jgi:predicted phosphoribosyltransferase